MKAVVAGLAGVFGVALACAPALSAQSIKQQELIASSKTQVAEQLAAANNTCGSNVKITVDWASFSDVSTSPDNPNQQSPWAFVVNVTDAMDSVCRGGDAGKTAIQNKLKLITVSHAKTEVMNFSNGTLHYEVPYNNSRPQKLIDYLKDNL